MNENDFANKYLNEFRTTKKNEIEAKLCPICNGGIHQDKWTFSINTDKHTYNCLRGKCNASGTFKDLTEKYNEVADYHIEWLKLHTTENKPKVEYVQPVYEVQELSCKVIEYFETRSISLATLLVAGVKSINNGYAVFQFFEGEKLVLNKIRLAAKPKTLSSGKKELKEWQEKGGKHILWNMNNINTAKPVILTEGMVDALSCIEAGEKNVVSIPNGTNDMSWIENSYEWIKKINEWIIYVDNDAAGEKLIAELILKFKSYRTRIVKHELKDANEELTTFGVKYITEVISKAEFPAVHGITNMAEVKIVNPSLMERSKTGIPVIDKMAGGYIFPSLNIWSGERGSGKSTVLSQTLLNCIEKDYKVFVYSGELLAGYFKLWLVNQAIGENNIHVVKDKEIGSVDYIPNTDILAKVDKWLNSKIYIYDDNNTNEEDKLMLLMEEAYKRYNCRVFVIDNLMTLKFNHNKDGIYRGQSDFVDRVRLFVKTNNLIVNLVVHPNKAGELGGAGDIGNAATNIFLIEKVDEKTNPYNTIVTIKKNRYYGKTEVYGEYYFSHKSKRIYEKIENERTYDWNEKEVTEVQTEIPF